MTIIDLRLEYKKEMGANCVPINYDYYDDVDYVLWLENTVLELKSQKEIKNTFIVEKPVKN